MKSSYDQPFAFEQEYAKAKQQNTKIDARFEQKMRQELEQAKKQFGEKSPEYRQFQRIIVEFAKKYDSSMKNLEAGFSVAKQKAREQVSSEIDRLSKDQNIKDAYQKAGWLEKPHVRAARAINVNSSIVEYVGVDTIKFQALSPEKRVEWEKKPFRVTKAESWKETTALLGEEFVNSIKDILLFFGSIPGSALILGEYMTLRAQRNNSLANEATLKLMLEEFLALALVDLATDWDKGGAMIKQLGKELASGTQGSVAMAIVTVVGLLAGGAGAAGKLSGTAGKLAKLWAKTAAKGNSLAAKTTTAALNATAKVGQAAESGLMKTAQVLNHVDDVVSGQRLVTAGVGTLEKWVRWSTKAAAAAATVATPKATQKPVDTVSAPRRLGNMSDADYTKMIEANAKLSDSARVSAVAKELNLKSLSDVQKKALLDAHNSGTSGAGKWTQAELREKYRILEQGGFTREQSRIILEKGYSGKGIKTPDNKTSSRLNQKQIYLDNLKTKVTWEWDTIIKTIDELELKIKSMQAASQKILHQGISERIAIGGKVYDITLFDWNTSKKAFL